MKIKQILKANEIWIFNYKRLSFEQKLYKLFVKYDIQYPKKGFYANCGSGKVLNSETRDLIFINVNLLKNYNFLKEIHKIGTIRNFSAGTNIITINIRTDYKIFKILGFEPNLIEDQTCKQILIDSKKAYFFKKDNLGYFILPQSYCDYFLQLINSFSNNLNLSSTSEIELENYYDFLIKRNS